MKQRCELPTNRSYPRYGGRGIRVCEEWLNSFAAFLRDVGPKPGLRYQIERIDNDGDYEPGNVRWATVGEQARNRHNNVTLTYEGWTMALIDWARERGIAVPTIYWRYHKGWSPARVLAVGSPSLVRRPLKPTVS